MSAAAPLPSPPPPAPVPAATRSPWVVGPAWDLFWLVLSPLWALALSALLEVAGANALALTATTPAVTFFAAVVTSAHLFAVFFRSHLNPGVFRLFPLRFTVVPVALFGAMALSTKALVAGGVLGVLWDVYHSSLQTFGFGRMYDARAGSDPARGRRLDYLLNLVLYIGPIAGGAVLLDHLASFRDFQRVGYLLLARAPEAASPWVPVLRGASLTAGALVLGWYVLAYRRLVRGGYRVAPLKVALFVSTGLTSLVAWGFNPFGQAFVIMNLFHAVQYFALVWHSEKKNLTRVMRVERAPFGQPLAFAVFVGASVAFGVFTEVSHGNDLAMAFAVTVALMHFWSDGFIWSVRKQQV